MPTTTAPRFTKTDLARMFREARDAGHKAATEAVPTPMVVVERANPWDDSSPVVRQYAPVMDGVCGFASVVIRPGNSQAARFAAAKFGMGNRYGTNPKPDGPWMRSWGLYGSKNYYGGYGLSVMGYGQSMTRKEAYARAFADVLRSYGVEAYATSRMD